MMMATMVVTAVVMRLDAVAAVSMLVVRMFSSFGMATVRAMSVLMCAVTV